MERATFSSDAFTHWFHNLFFFKLLCIVSLEWLRERYTQTMERGLRPCSQPLPGRPLEVVLLCFVSPLDRERKGYACLLSLGPVLSHLLFLQCWLNEGRLHSGKSPGPGEERFASSAPQHTGNDLGPCEVSPQLSPYSLTTSPSIYHGVLLSYPVRGARR